MSRVRVVLIAVLFLASGGVLKAEESPFNVDFFCGWGDCYRPMEWTPVEIGVVSTLEQPLGCAIEISAAQDGLNTLNIRHRFVLTPDVPANLPLVTKFAFAADRCDIRLIEVVNGRLRRTVYSEKRDFWGGRPGDRRLKAITENDMLIGHIGDRRFGLLTLPKQAVAQSQRGRGRVYLGHKLIRMVPWDWTGFVSLDVLILYDPDWNQFDRRQLQAISQWVSNGGKLLLVLGTHPLAANNPIAQLLPVNIGQIKQTTANSALLGKWDLQGDASEMVACWPLAVKPGVRLCETQRCDANDCLFATGNVGFGRVGVLAFDPSTLSDRHRARSSRFWVGRIKAVLEDSHSLPVGAKNSGSSPSSANRPRGSVVESFRTIRFEQDTETSSKNQQDNRRYQIGLGQAANNAVMNFLYKGIRPLSIWWVILLLAALALLLGPVDYIVLKRWGRLPLTWLTCTFWIAVFTVGAYYGVQYLRSGDMEMRVVSVLDGIENEGSAWSTNYCGLFAPRSAEYRLKDLGEKQWWSGIAPTQQNIYSYRRETGGRKIYCEQEDGENRPRSLPISIWTIQCLMNEAVIERLPFKAQVRRRGEQITVKISNESDAAIINGYVLFDNRMGIRLNGIVEARAGEEFSGTLSRLDAWRSNDANRLRNSYYNYRPSGNAGSLKREDAYYAQGCLQRTRAIDAYLAHGAAVVCVEYENAQTSFKVDARSCDYDHIRLARLVVFPREDGRETEQ